MVPVSYIVTAIVSAAFGSVTTIFMLSITAAAKKADTDRDLCDDNMYKKRRELFFCNLLQQADDFFVLTHKNEILFNLCA